VPNPTATKYTKGEHIPLLPKCSYQRICIVCVCACMRGHFNFVLPISCPSCCSSS